MSNHLKAGVVELVDTLDLGSSASRRESSSLSFRTIVASIQMYILAGILIIFLNPREILVYYTFMNIVVPIYVFVF